MENKHLILLDTLEKVSEDIFKLELIERGYIEKLRNCIKEKLYDDGLRDLILSYNKRRYKHTKTNIYLCINTLPKRSYFNFESYFILISDIKSEQKMIDISFDKIHNNKYIKDTKYIKEVSKSGYFIDTFFSQKYDIELKIEE